MLSLLVMLTRELGGVMFLYQFIFFWLLLVIPSMTFNGFLTFLIDDYVK